MLNERGAFYEILQLEQGGWKTDGMKKILSLGFFNKIESSPTYLHLISITVITNQDWETLHDMKTCIHFAIFTYR